jgi:hypothetical protein
MLTAAAAAAAAAAAGSTSVVIYALVSRSLLLAHLQQRVGCPCSHQARPTLSAAAARGLVDALLLLLLQRSRAVWRLVVEQQPQRWQDSWAAILQVEDHLQEDQCSSTGLQSVTCH